MSQVLARDPAGRRKDALKHLAIARQATVDPETGVVYLQRLRGVDPDVLEEACLELGNQPRAEYQSTFPSVGDILEHCERIARARVAPKALSPAPAAVLGADQTYRCPFCQDEPNGWREFACPEVKCARTTEHPPHVYVARCRCWFLRNGNAVEYAIQQAQEKRKPLTPGMQDVIRFNEGRYPWAHEPVQQQRRQA